MQKLYHNYDEEHNIGIFQTKVYDEAFYIFSLYNILITIYRKNQYDLIFNNIDIPSIKKELLFMLKQPISEKHDTKLKFSENDILIIINI